MSSLPVLFLARGGDIDGQQRQVLNLAAGLAHHRTPLTAILSEPGNLLNELRTLGVDAEVSRMRSWRSLGRIFDRYVDANRLLTIARRRAIKIVHAHDVWRSEYARFLAKRLGTPYIVHIRGPLDLRDIKKHRLRDADIIIAIAQRYIDDLVAAGIDRDRIVLVDDAVDLQLFDPEQADPSYIQRSFGINGRRLVGLVGRLSPFKRVSEFIDILTRLPPSVVATVDFVIAGEWDTAKYRERVKAQVRGSGLEPRIHFVGHCPSHHMPQMLSGLDLLVTLSGGSTMFEAMAMSTPVLSIRSDGRHSLHTRHGHTAWCVDGSDSEVAAEALAHLLDNNDLRQRLGHAAREWVVRNLSSATMVNRTERVYEMLAQRHAGDDARSRFD
jgi:glycosyltransferase involved in cell wall biosynthesis